MIDGRRLLAVVPARGGSKGVPLKNLRQVGGVSLVARAGHLVRELLEIDRAVVSTDHDGIAQAATEAGLDAPFRRPEELSGDLVSDLDVLTHALLACESADDVRYDVVLMLQPTSPLRRPSRRRCSTTTAARGRTNAAKTAADPIAILDAAADDPIAGAYVAEHRPLILLAMGKEEDGVVALLKATEMTGGRANRPCLTDHGGEIDRDELGLAILAVDDKTDLLIAGNHRFQRQPPQFAQPVREAGRDRSAGRCASPAARTAGSARRSAEAPAPSRYALKASSSFPTRGWRWRCWRRRGAASCAPAWASTPATWAW